MYCLHILSIVEQLRNRLKEFNDVAVIKIENQDYNQALIYLEEAEKLLEAVVSSPSKKIQRIFIICTLQNQACAYQRLWELEKSAEYMEAIIHNMQCQVQINTSAQLQQIYFTEDAIDNKQALKATISKLTLMGLYYLQYLAVTSQIKDHEAAYLTSANALKTFKTICQKCVKLQNISQSRTESVFVHSGMLGQLAIISDEADVQKIPQYIKQTKRALAKLRISASRKKSITDRAVICFRDFAIGEVMQISPITLNQLTKRMNSKQQITNMSKLYKALYISICLFSMATEKRLICTQVSRKNKSIKNNHQQNQFELSQSLKISQVFHLRAIYVACKYIPCQNKYLEHIIRSLKNHYDIDLNESSSDLIEQVSSIDIQSQNLVTSCDKIDPQHHKNVQPDHSSNNYIVSETRYKPSYKKLKTFENQFQSPKGAESVQFGNTIIKKQMQYHYKKKVYKQQRKVKTIITENSKTKFKKEISKSKSKSKKKTNRNLKNSKLDKKQNHTVLTQKRTNPTSIRQTDQHHPQVNRERQSGNRYVSNKQSAKKNTDKYEHPIISNYGKNIQPNNLPDSRSAKKIDRLDQKHEARSQLRKKKKQKSVQRDKQKSKDRQKQREKSKPKSHSKSNKRLCSRQQKHIKSGSTNLANKTKKKHHRLQQQYLIRPQAKKQKRKTMGSMQYSARNEHSSGRNQKSGIKKNSIRIEEGSPPGRNTVFNSKNCVVSCKQSIRYL